jgi:hypothetical protein
MPLITTVENETAARGDSGGGTISFRKQVHRHEDTLSSGARQRAVASSKD